MSCGKYLPSSGEQAIGPTTVNTDKAMQCFASSRRDSSRTLLIADVSLMSKPTIRKTPTPPKHDNPPQRRPGQQPNLRREEPQAQQSTQSPGVETPPQRGENSQAQELEPEPTAMQQEAQEMDPGKQKAEETMTRQSASASDGASR